MRYIINNSTDPYFNIALEEYCLMHVDPKEDYFLLWQNQPSVIIGKNQNALEEINQSFIEEKGIKVVRRISGGGAVYQDLGNLNYTFISRVDPNKGTDFSIFSDPVVRVLKDLGVEAMTMGRNDIVAYDKKISGNAQRLYRKRLMQHGTLMFDVNIADMARALNVSSDKIESKGIKSIRSRVGNIKEFLGEDMSTEDFKKCLQKELSNDYKSKEIVLKQEDIARVSKLARAKFASWDWTYGESPPFNYRFEKRFSGGKVGVFIHVKDGLIQGCKFYGDFLSLLDTEDFARRLSGLRYDKKTVKETLEDLEIAPYFGSISREELLEILF